MISAARYSRSQEVARTLAAVKARSSYNNYVINFSMLCAKCSRHHNRLFRTVQSRPAYTVCLPPAANTSSAHSEPRGDGHARRQSGTGEVRETRRPTRRIGRSRRSFRISVSRAFPSRIDRSVLTRFSGVVGTQLMHALRFLGLIGDRWTPDPASHGARERARRRGLA